MRLGDAWHEQHKPWFSHEGKKEDTSLASLTLLLAEIYLLRGRYDDSRYLAEMVVNLYQSNCADPTSIGLAKAERLLAQILAASWGWHQIAERFTAIEAGLAGEPGAFARLYGAAFELPMALLQLGRVDEAAARMAGWLEDSEAADPKEAAEFAGLQAIVAAKQGDADDAARRFAKAVPVLIDQFKGQKVGVQRRIQDVRVQYVLDGYLDFLVGALAGGRAGDRWGRRVGGGVSYRQLRPYGAGAGGRWRPRRRSRALPIRPWRI